MKTQYNILPPIQRQQYFIHPVDRIRNRTRHMGDTYSCGICFDFDTNRFDDLYDHVIDHFRRAIE